MGEVKNVLQFNFFVVFKDVCILADYYTHRFVSPLGIYNKQQLACARCHVLQAVTKVLLH